MPSLLKVIVANVGQGDTIVILSPDGRVAVVDCYDGQKVSDCLHHLGKSKIDLLATTHPHYDHIKGVPHLIREFEVDMWWDAKAPCPSKTYLQINQLCRDRKIPAICVGGSNFSTDLGPVTVKALAPSASQRKRIDAEVKDNGSMLPWRRSFNDYSFVLGVRYGDFHMVLGSDAEMETWSSLQAELQDELQCHVLKLPHHGSSRGSHFQMLEKMGPQHVIISYAEGNPHGHPDELTTLALSKYESTASKAVSIWHTARHGTLVVESSGSTRPSVRGCGDSPSEPLPDLSE